MPLVQLDLIAASSSSLPISVIRRLIGLALRQHHWFGPVRLLRLQLTGFYFQQAVILVDAERNRQDKQFSSRETVCPRRRSSKTLCPPWQSVKASSRAGQHLRTLRQLLDGNDRPVERHRHISHSLLHLGYGSQFDNLPALCAALRLRHTGKLLE